MDKSLARAKHAASLRGRRRFSQRRQPGAAAVPAAAVGTPGELELWDEYQDVLPLEGLDQSNGPFDYAELLSRDPFYELTETSFAAWDPLQDALQDLYYAQDSGSGQDKMASLLSLDLDKLGESLATMSLATRLCLDDESLPSELLELKDGTETEVKDDGLEEVQGTPLEPDAIADTNTEDQTLEVKAAEDDLDALLNMLDDVKIGHASAVRGIVEPGRDEEEDQRYITANERGPRQKSVEVPEQGQVSAAANEDFDAWLDSLG